MERAKAAVGGVLQNEALRRSEIWRSLGFLVCAVISYLFAAKFMKIYRQVGIPYLRAKAHDYYEELSGSISSDILDEGMDARRLWALTEEVRD